MKNPHAAALGKRGGKAGTGTAKARSSEQARAAAMARWSKKPCAQCGGDGKYSSEIMARYGDEPHKCEMCGGTGWQQVVPGQIHACDCKRFALPNAKDQTQPKTNNQ